MYKPTNGKIAKKIFVKNKQISAGFIAYNTIDCGFWKKIGRLFFIKGITNSRFEHIAVISKLHQTYDGEVWVSRFERTKKITIQKNTHYVIEATQHYGVVISEFLDRMLRPSLDEDIWTGDVIYFMWKKDFVKKEYFAALTQFIKEVNSSNKQYNLVNAIVSALPNKVQDFFIKIFKLNVEEPQVFCSSLASYAASIAMDLGITKKEVQRLSPQEAIDLFFQKGYIENSVELLQYTKGKISAYNSDVFEIEF